MSPGTLPTRRFLGCRAVAARADPTTVLGIDETRARSVRWLRESTGWRRSDPWLSSFVNVDPNRRGLLLGLAPGRSGGCVKGWRGCQVFCVSRRGDL